MNSNYTSFTVFERKKERKKERKMNE